MFNQATFVGNLAKDPKMREAGDKDVCGFRIAVNKPGGKRDDEPLWVNVSVWGKSADACDKYLRKGSRVLVTGRLSLRTWESDNGTRTELELDARDVVFLTPKGDSDARDDRGRGRDRDDDDRGSRRRPREGDKSSARESYERSERGRRDIPDDDIPF